MPENGNNVGRTLIDAVFDSGRWLKAFSKRHPFIGIILLLVIIFSILLLMLWQVPSGQKQIDQVVSDILPNPSASGGSSLLEQGEEDKEKVILLLPTGLGVADSIKQDAERQILGFLDYLSSHEPEDENSLEVVVRSHGMERTRAEQIVREEMSRGNRFFVVTMSRIAEPLARNWQTINEESCVTKPCVLIATVSSAPGISNSQANVYRFYVRSKEEAESLARIASPQMPRKNVVSICVDDAYGRGAARKFKETWELAGGTITSEVFLAPGLSDEGMDRKFNDVARLSEPDRAAVFIANYGSGLSSTIRELDERSLYPQLLLTSTFSIKDWRLPVGEILGKFTWLSLQPAYKDGGRQDVVRNFTFFSLLRLQEAIFFSRSHGCSFDIAWRQVKSPQELSFSIDESGDSQVDLVEFGPEDSASQVDD